MSLEAARERISPPQSAWLSAFGSRYAYTALLVGYFLWLGAVPGGPLSTAMIVGLTVLYVPFVAGVQIYSRGQRLGKKLGYGMLAIEMPLLVVAVSHDPVPAMPLMMFALGAQIELAQRYEMRVYRVGVAASLLACVLALAVRYYWVPGGIAPAAYWTAGYLLPISLYVSLLVGQMHRSTNVVTDTASQIDLVAGATGIGFWVNDLEQSWLLWDDNTHRLAGLEPGTFRGTYEHLYSLLLEGDVARVKLEFENAVKQRKPIDVEYKMVWPDKSVHRISNRARMVLNDEGRVVRMIGASWEETHHPTVDDDLVRRGDRLALALQLTGAGVWIYDVPARTVEWDDNLHAMFGLKPGTFGGTLDDFIQRVHPADRARVEQAIEDGLAGRKEYSIEMRMLAADNGERIIKTMARVYFDEAGKRGLRALKMLGVALDVTEARQVQDRLRVLTERSRLATQALRIGRWSYDPALDRQEVDEGLEGLFGVEPGMLGSTLGSLLARLPSEERTRFREAAAAVKNGEEFNWRFRVVRPDGSAHDLIWIGGAQQKDGAFVLRAAVGDLTRLRGARREL